MVNLLGRLMPAGLSPYRFLLLHHDHQHQHHHHHDEKSEEFCEEGARRGAHYPHLEVFLADVPKFKSFLFEPINFEQGFTLLKAQLSSSDASNIEALVEKSEGASRLFKNSFELVNTLQREVQDGRLCFRGKKVLELGCGHGLPGIFACLKGAATVHFQDLNPEILRSLTIPNVVANLEVAKSRQARLYEAGQATPRSMHFSPELHFYSGDCTNVDTMLSCLRPVGASQTDDSCDAKFSDGNEPLVDSWQMGNVKRVIAKRMFSGTRACERGNNNGAVEGGYDIILLSDSVYSLLSLPKLYNLLKKCLRPPYGVVYLAGKKPCYGYNGGTRRFKHILEEDGILGAHLVMDFTERPFLGKETWKFFYR